MDAQSFETIPINSTFRMDRLHPGVHQPVGDVLGGVGRSDDDRDVARLPLEVGLEVVDVPHHQAVPAGAHLLGVAVVYGRDVEAALAKAGILHQGAADATGPDDDDAIGAPQAEDVAQARGELAHRVAQSPLAEGAEEGQVLAHLGRGRGAAAGEVGGGDGGVALPVGVLEEPKVEREAAYRALGDLPHIVNYFTIGDSRARAWQNPRAPPAPAALRGRGPAPRAERSRPWLSCRSRP